MGIFDQLNEQEEKNRQSSPFVSKNEDLDKKAFRRACKTSQGSSLLVKLEDDKQINQAIKGMKNFDHRVIAMINRWSNSEHPEQEAERVIIDGKRASQYMTEKGYSFMDCMLLAQNAVRRNKPGVEFDVEISGEQNRYDRKMNLSDPNLQNIPPSHMPRTLNNILKIVTLGFFQNRAERLEFKREMEMIRFAAMEKERQARLEKDDKSAYAQEVKRKREQNKERAETGKKLQAEYELGKRDEKHSKEGLEGLEAYQKKASLKLIQLGERREQLAEKAAANQKKMAELEKEKNAARIWLESNPDWKKDADKRKTFAEMTSKINAYHEVRKEHEQLGKDMARVYKTSEKLMAAVGEMEGKRPRLTELYHKQGEHTLTEQERKELEQLEKPGVVMQGRGQVTKERLARAEMAMKQGAKIAQQVQENVKQTEKTEKQISETVQQPQKTTKQAEKTAQQAPKAAQQGAKTAQQGAKTVQQEPKTAQQAPKTTQQGAKTAQQAPKTDQQSAKTVQQASKSEKQAQDAQKKAPEAAKRTPDKKAAAMRRR